LWRVTEKAPFAKLSEEFARLSEAATREIRGEGWKGSIREERSLDMRYCGQGHELNVPLSRRLIAEFHAAHARRYGYGHPEREVELVTLRLRAKIKSPESGRSGRLLSGEPARDSGRHIEKTSVVFEGRELRTSIFERKHLVMGKKYRGPAVVTEYSATSFVSPGAKFWIDRAQNLLIDVSRT